MSRALAIEEAAYKDFRSKYAVGIFGTQRLGQAFYNHFKLELMGNQEQLEGLYEKDGAVAEQAIHDLFELT